MCQPSKIPALFILVAGLLSFTGCQGSKQNSNSLLFADQVEGLAWGAPLAELDSLFKRDSAWLTSSIVPESSQGGTIYASSKRNRDYYFYFSPKDKFYLMSFIADSGDPVGYDSTKILIERSWGGSDKAEKISETSMNYIWNRRDPRRLEIQLIRTNRRFSLQVTNLDY